MKSALVLLSVWLSATVTLPLFAQCVPPARVAQLRADAVRVLAGRDSSQRRIFDLPRIAASRIHVVRDSATCHRAGEWYVRHLMSEDSTITTSTPFAVVQADSLLFVEPDVSAGHRGCCWVVRVFDLAGRKRYSYGEGS